MVMVSLHSNRCSRMDPTPQFFSEQSLGPLSLESGGGQAQGLRQQLDGSVLLVVGFLDSFLTESAFSVTSGYAVLVLL